MMTIKVLGPGCMNCRTLEQRTREALAEIKLDALVEKVTDFNDMASYGILRTPGLVIDGKLVVQGMVPQVQKIKEIILAAQKESSVS
jgi:small redox-active disulfide protein 2